MKRKWLVLLLLLLVSLSGLSALAQDDALASGLNNPRHISYGPDGTLYIAEAGSGGDIEVEGPFGPVVMGLSAQVTAVSPDGEQSVVIPELVSMDNGFGQIEGITAVYVTDDAYWLVLGMGPRPAPDDTSVEAVVALGMDMEASQVIDLRAFEEENNPDEAAEVVSNPIDLAVASDGTLLILDASGNSLLSWTEADGLELVNVWLPVPDEAQAVPTSLDVDADGNVYVGFLSGFPFAPEGARIEVWSPDGELTETYEGLTLVTDILLGEDGTLYAVQMAEGFGDQGFIPESGSVVMVSEDGIEPIAEGLNYPYGIAQSPDGTLVVTVNSAFSGPDAGQVIALEM